MRRELAKREERADGEPDDEQPYLALFADRDAMRLMDAVRTGPRTRAELSDALGVSGGTLGRRLAKLVRLEMLDVERASGRGRANLYLLSHRGAERLAILPDLAAAKDALIAAAGLDFDPPVELWLADALTRRMLRYLLGVPRTVAELVELIPNATRRRVETRLAELCAGGLLVKAPGGGEGARYRATELIAVVRRVAVRTARWRARWTPDRLPEMAGDLPGIVLLLIVCGLLDPPKRAHGHMLLHVDVPDGCEHDWPDVDLSLVAGRLKVETLSPPAGYAARAHGTALAWCDALLTGRLGGISVDGDRMLIEATVRCLAAGLVL